MTRHLTAYRTGRLFCVDYTDVEGPGRLHMTKATAEALHRRLGDALKDWPDSPLDMIELEAERMFHAKYDASWSVAAGEKPYWIPFATHDQCCSLGAKEANAWRAKAEASLRERGLIADPQGTLKGVK